MKIQILIKNKMYVIENRLTHSPPKRFRKPT